MEISLQHDDQDEYSYTTTIQGVDNKTTILEILYHGRHLNFRDDSPVNNWIKNLQAGKKKQKKTLIISLLADRSDNYRRNTFKWATNWPNHMSKNPYELLQICVDNHILFYETETPRDHDYNQKYSPPTSLLRLFSDDKTLVVGVGIEDVAKKLEKDFYLKISRFVDLRVKAREKGYGEVTKNCNVLKLAKKVLGDEWDVNKPANMNWWNTEFVYDFLSDDKVKFGSVEAFLAYKIGTKLLSD